MAGICVSFVFISNAVRCVKATVVYERPVSLLKGPNRAALFYPVDCDSQGRRRR